MAGDNAHFNVVPSDGFGFFNQAAQLAAFAFVAGSFQHGFRHGRTDVAIEQRFADQIALKGVDPNTTGVTEVIGDADLFPMETVQVFEKVGAVIPLHLATVDRAFNLRPGQAFNDVGTR